jgi:hypothetical protein
LVRLASEAKRCNLENGTIPALPSLSEPDIAEMGEFLEQMLLIYPPIGISVFQKPMTATPQTQLLYLKAKGLKAVGYEAPDGFVLRAGSQTPKTCVPSTPEIVRRWREHLTKQGLFVQENDHLKLTEDYNFSSPSLAAAVMLARSANGRIEWKDVSGRTLKEIQTAAATETDRR